MELSNEEREFQDRSLRVSLFHQDWDQDILKKAHIVIGGVGALGCEIATRLALMGIGKLTLIDYDEIETSNLSRQLLFRWQDRGKPKVEAAKRTLKEMNQFTDIQIFAKRIEKVATEVYDSADVIVSAVDGFIHRLTLNMIALLTNKPLVEGGFSAFDGHLAIVEPNKTPCLWCLGYRPTERAAINPCIIRGFPERREHCVFKAEIEFQNQEGTIPNLKEELVLKKLLEISNDFVDKYSGGEWKYFEKMEVLQLLEQKQASLLTSATVIAGIQAHEIIKLLHRQKKKDIGPRLNGTGANYAMINLRNLQIQIIHVQQDQECIHCQKYSYENIKHNLHHITLSFDNSLENLIEKVHESSKIQEKIILITRMNDFSQIYRIGMTLDKKLNELNVFSGDIIKISYQNQALMYKVTISNQKKEINPN